MDIEHLLNMHNAQYLIFQKNSTSDNNLFITLCTVQEQNFGAVQTSTIAAVVSEITTWKTYNELNIWLIIAFV